MNIIKLIKECASMAQTKKPKKRGLGSDSIDEETKHRIQSMGGKASHGGGRKPLA
jgi:hypothetical protein